MVTNNPISWNSAMSAPPEALRKKEEFSGVLPSISQTAKRSTLNRAVPGAARARTIAAGKESARAVTLSIPAPCCCWICFQETLPWEHQDLLLLPGGGTTEKWEVSSQLGR